MVGSVVSFTSTSAVQVAVLPASSRAVNVTVVVPSGKSEGALLVMVGVSSQLSDAVAPFRNAAIAALADVVPPNSVHSTVILDGQPMLGGVLSSGMKSK